MSICSTVGKIFFQLFDLFSVQNFNLSFQNQEIVANIIWNFKSFDILIFHFQLIRFVSGCQESDVNGLYCTDEEFWEEGIGDVRWVLARREGSRWFEKKDQRRFFQNSQRRGVFFSNFINVLKIIMLDQMSHDLIFIIYSLCNTF